MNWLAPFLDGLYVLAAFLGFVGGCAGNRFAWPLLGMFAFCQTVRWQGWAFDPELWGKADSAVLIALLVLLLAQKRPPDWRQWGVVLLFVPAIAVYAVQKAHPYAAYVVSSLAAIAQLAIVFPWGLAWEALRKASVDLIAKDDFDLRVRT